MVYTHMYMHTGFSSSTSDATSTPTPTKQTIYIPQSPLPGLKKLTSGEE